MMTRIIEAWKFRPMIRVFLLILIFSLFFAGFTAAQQNFDDTDLLSSSFHQGRRDSLRKLLPSQTCAIFFANPVRNRTNDVDYQYVQDPDFYYLTGYCEPQSVLMLFSEPVEWEGAKTTEVLFVQERDAQNEMWNGKLAGKEYITGKLGLRSLAYNYELDQKFPSLKPYRNIWVKWPVDIGKGEGKKNSLNWMVAQVESRLQDSGKEPQSAPLTTAMSALREIKQPEELILMQKAVDMTVEGLAEACRATKPGMTEYQAQAIVEYYFKHRGSEYPGYGSIAGGGNNSCVLHYVSNRKKLSDGDMLLMDMGAEYHGYTADVTRTIPVNGRFNESQRRIYELVLEAQLAGIAECRPGKGFHEPHLAAQKVISDGLKKLGIITADSDANRYFPHGTSHYLGLEVHDAGNYGPLKANMVITVEPGIYISEGSPCDPKWWGIGIRIEDDILITDNQPIVMSGKLPKSVQELENLMAEPSLFESVK